MGDITDIIKLGLDPQSIAIINQRLKVLWQERGGQIVVRLTQGTFLFSQSTPSVIWDINHNLGFYPNVSVTDSSNRMVLTDINYVDNNNLQVMVANAFSGTAYLS